MRIGARQRVPAGRARDIRAARPGRRIGGVHDVARRHRDDDVDIARDHADDPARHHVALDIGIDIGAGIHLGARAHVGLDHAALMAKLLASAIGAMYLKQGYEKHDQEESK